MTGIKSGVSVVIEEPFSEDASPDDKLDALPVDDALCEVAFI